MPVRMPSRSHTAASASHGVLPAPAPKRRVEPSICDGAGADRERSSWRHRARGSRGRGSRPARRRRARRRPRATRSPTSSRIIAPAESTTYTHWQPASTMIRACAASASGVCVWAIIRKPTVSRPSSRASPKCWIEMSASVQCVAMRTIDTPRSATARMSSFVPTPGQHQRGDLGLAWRSRRRLRSGRARRCGEPVLERRPAEAVAVGHLDDRHAGASSAATTARGPPRS